MWISVQYLLLLQIEFISLSEILGCIEISSPQNMACLLRNSQSENFEFRNYYEHLFHNSKNRNDMKKPTKKWHVNFSIMNYSLCIVPSRANVFNLEVLLYCCMCLWLSLIYVNVGKLLFVNAQSEERTSNSEPMITTYTMKRFTTICVQ